MRQWQHQSPLLHRAPSARWSSGDCCLSLIFIYMVPYHWVSLKFFGIHFVHMFSFVTLQCMLTKTSAGLHGARLLLDCGVTSRLAECSVFDLRPEPDR